MRVCNHSPQSPLQRSINWNVIIQAALEHGQLDKHRGNYHVDVGHASDHNTTRRGCVLGISQPRTLEHTFDDRYTDLFRNVSKVIPTLVPDEFREKVFRSNKERTKEFAGSIVEGNIVETLRAVSYTHLTLPTILLV